MTSVAINSEDYSERRQRTNLAKDKGVWLLRGKIESLVWRGFGADWCVRLVAMTKNCWRRWWRCKL